MKLFELAQDDLNPGYYNPSEDTINSRTPGDTRKEKLTLRKINRLKKMRALKQLERMKRQDLLGVMYAPADDSGGGMGGFGF